MNTQYSAGSAALQIDNDESEAADGACCAGLQTSGSIHVGQGHNAEWNIVPTLSKLAEIYNFLQQESGQLYICSELRLPGQYANAIAITEDNGIKRTVLEANAGSMVLAHELGHQLGLNHFSTGAGGHTSSHVMWYQTSESATYVTVSEGEKFEK